MKTLMIAFMTYNFFSVSPDKPTYVKLATELARLYAEDVIKEDHLILEGYGGSMYDDIKVVSFTFLGFHELKLNEARVLYVKSVQKFLNSFNTAPRIRSYMHNYPFTEKNIDLSIRFKNKKNSEDLAPPYISYVKNIGEFVYYKVTDPATNKFVELKKEKYEEALRIVREQGFQL